MNPLKVTYEIDHKGKTTSYTGTMIAVVYKPEQYNDRTYGVIITKDNNITTVPLSDIKVAREVRKPYVRKPFP